MATGVDLSRMLEVAALPPGRDHHGSAPSSTRRDRLSRTFSHAEREGNRLRDEARFGKWREIYQPDSVAEVLDLTGGDFQHQPVTVLMSPGAGAIIARRGIPGCLPGGQRPGIIRVPQPDTRVRQSQ